MHQDNKHELLESSPTLYQVPEKKLIRLLKDPGQSITRGIAKGENRCSATGINRKTKIQIGLDCRLQLEEPAMHARIA